MKTEIATLKSELASVKSELVTQKALNKTSQRTPEAGADAIDEAHVTRASKAAAKKEIRSRIECGDDGSEWEVIE